MERFNPKISTTGEYLPFYGWSIISMVSNDLKIVENYISKHQIIRKYVSALPSSSYHMTLYNLWSNGQPLLPQQLRCLKRIAPEQMKTFVEDSKKYELFNPHGCINELLYKMYFEMNQDKWEPKKITIKKVFFNGNAIRMSLQQPENTFVQINNNREKLAQMAEVEDGMGSYHITLAYKYKDLNQEDLTILNNEVEIINLLLENQTVTLERPMVCYFDNMTEFKPFQVSL